MTANEGERKSEFNQHPYLFGFRHSIIKQQEYQRDVSAINSSETGYYNNFNVTLAQQVSLFSLPLPLSLSEHSKNMN